MAWTKSGRDSIPTRRRWPAGGRVELQVILRNHSPQARGVPRDAACARRLERARRSAAGYRAGRARSARSSIPVTAGSAGLGIVTADVAFGAWDLREWTEAMVTAK